MSKEYSPQIDNGTEWGNYNSKKEQYEATIEKNQPLLYSSIKKGDQKKITEILQELISISSGWEDKESPFMDFIPNILCNHYEVEGKNFTPIQYAYRLKAHDICKLLVKDYGDSIGECDVQVDWS